MSPTIRTAALSGSAFISDCISMTSTMDFYVTPFEMFAALATASVFDVWPWALSLLVAQRCSAVRQSRMVTDDAGARQGVVRRHDPSAI